MVKGKCPHPWNKNKKGSFTKNHEQVNNGKGCFKKGEPLKNNVIEINRKLGKERYNNGTHPFFKTNKIRQELALKEHWYGIGKAKWKELSKKIYERDKGLCQICGNKGYQIHHKMPYSVSHNNNENNLINLCTSCHNKEERKIQKLIGIIWDF